jgi:peptidoglycan/LPS O-acetylase OafA/YrhL
MQNIKYLHIIRGFAAFFVLLAHAKWPFWIGGTAFLKQTSFWELSVLDKAGLAFALLSSNGTAMVIIFYVLSGFIIAHSFSKNKWSYKQFIINRSLRIYIPYIASALIAGLLLVISYRLANVLFESPVKDYHQRVMTAYSSGLNLTNFIKTVFFFKTERVNYFGFNYVYWSLLYEMIFYLVFPLLLKYLKYIFVATLVIYPVHIFYQPLPEIDYWYLYLTEYLFYFLSGIYLYRFVISGKLDFYKGSVWLKKYVLLAIVGLSFFSAELIGFSSYKSISFLAATVMSLSWMIYLLLYGAKNGYFTKLFMFLGKISYSLYLIHVPLLLFFYSLVFYFFSIDSYSSPWVYLFFALMTIPLAYVFYYLFEKLSFSLIEAHKKKIKQKALVEETALKTM